MILNLAQSLRKGNFLQTAAHIKCRQPDRLQTIRKFNRRKARTILKCLVRNMLYAARNRNARQIDTAFKSTRADSCDGIWDGNICQAFKVYKRIFRNNRCPWLYDNSFDDSIILIPWASFCKAVHSAVAVPQIRFHNRQHTILINRPGNRPCSEICRIGSAFRKPNHISAAVVGISITAVVHRIESNKSCRFKSLLVKRRHTSREMKLTQIGASSENFPA